MSNKKADNMIVYVESEKEAFEIASAMKSSPDGREYIVKITRTEYGNFCIKKIPNSMVDFLLDNEMSTKKFSYI